MNNLLHQSNITLHVLSSLVALALATYNIINRKGGSQHKRTGRIFLKVMIVVLVTAIAGTLYFNFRAFLGVLTLLVCYNSFSGFRTLRIKDSGPVALDGVVSVIGLIAGIAFIFFIRSVKLPWSPVLIYSTLSSLFLVCTYDLLRFSFRRRWFRDLWLYEHIYKFISCFGALLSAFMGTVAVRWQPYSQIMPSVLATAMIVFFCVKSFRFKSSQPETLNLKPET